MPDYTKPFEAITASAVRGADPFRARRGSLADLPEDPKFLIGNESSGFEVTDDPRLLPQPGFFSVLGGAKNVLSNINVSSGMLGRGQGSEYLRKQALGIDPFADINTGETTLVSGMKSMFDLFPELGKSTSDIIAREDQDFNGPKAWETFTQEEPDLALFLTGNGLSPEMFASTRNPEAFRYSVNINLMRLKAMQTIDLYNRRVSGLESIGNKVLSAGLNYIVMNPDTPKLAVLGTAGSINAAKALTAAKGGFVARNTSGLAHGIISRVGAKAAISAEGALYGFGTSLVEQKEAAAFADDLYSDPRFGRDFSMTELAFATSLGAVIPWAGMSLIQGGKALRRSLMKDAGVVVEDSAQAVLGTTPEAMAYDVHSDTQLVQAHRTLSRHSVELEDVMSREVLRSTGVTPTQLNRFLRSLDTEGAPLTPRQVQAEVEDFLAQAAERLPTDPAPEAARIAAIRAEGAARARLWREARELDPEGAFSPVLRGLPKTNQEIRDAVRKEIARVAKAEGLDPELAQSALPSFSADDYVPRTRAAQDRLARRNRVEAPDLREDADTLLAEGLDVSGQSVGAQRGVVNRILDARPQRDVAARARAMTALGEKLRNNGLVQALHKGITTKTGSGETVFSRFDEMISVSEMFDRPRANVDSFLTQKRGGGNFLFARSRAVGEFDEKVISAFEPIYRKATREQRTQLNREVLDAIVNESTPASPEAAQMLKGWKRYFADTRRRGIETGTLPASTPEGVRVPLRINPGEVLRDRRAAVASLLQHTTDRLRRSDTLSPEVLESLGWITQTVDEIGEVTRRVTPDAPFDQVPTLKTQLQEGLLRQYDEAVPDNPILEREIRGFVARSLREDVASDTRTALREAHAVYFSDNPNLPITSAALTDPVTSRFFITDLGEIGGDYARRTGVRINMQKALNDHLGVRGVSVLNFINIMKDRTLRKWEGIATDQDLRQIKAGFDKLNEVALDLQGSLPQVVSDSDAIQNFGARLGRDASTMFFGGPIGGTIGGVETTASVFFRVQNPVDFGRNLFAAFKAATPGLRRGELRDSLAGFDYGSRMFTNQNNNRFVMGASDQGLDWTFGSRLSRQARKFTDQFSLSLMRERGVAQQSANIVQQGVQSSGALSMELGGSRYFTEIAWNVHMGSLRRETARFLPKAKALREALKGVDLVAIERDKGFPAAVKAWKGLAKKAGFGGKWQIAKRFQDAGLLETGYIEAIEAAGEVTGGLTKGDIDLMRLSNGMDELPDDLQDFLQEAINRVRDSHEATIQKRISEPSPFAKPTSEASRTPIGMMMNSMLSYSRSFYDNNVLDAPGMPPKNWMAFIGGTIFLESAVTIARRLTRGESLEDIQAEYEANPVSFVASTMLRVPLMGAATFVPKTMMEVDPYKWQLNGSAGTSSATQILNLAFETARAPRQLVAGEEVTLPREIGKHVERSVPLVNSMFGQALLTSMGAHDKQQRRFRERQRRAPGDGAFQGGGEAPPINMSRPQAAEPEEFDFTNIIKAIP